MLVSGLYIVKHLVGISILEYVFEKNQKKTPFLVHVDQKSTVGYDDSTSVRDTELSVMRTL